MEVSMTESNGKMAESAEQDQTARMYMLILLYTLRQINPWSRTSEESLFVCVCLHYFQHYFCYMAAVYFTYSCFPELSFTTTVCRALLSGRPMLSQIHVHVHDYNRIKTR